MDPEVTTSSSPLLILVSKPTRSMHRNEDSRVVNGLKVRIVRDPLPERGTGDPAYAAAKFDEAVHTLATHFGSLRERLWLAYGDFQPVSERDMPPHLIEALKMLKRDFSRLAPNARSQDSVGATVSRIRRKGCEDLAERVVRMSDALRTWVQKRPAP